SSAIGALENFLIALGRGAGVFGGYCQQFQVVGLRCLVGTFQQPAIADRAVQPVHRAYGRPQPVQAPEQRFGGGFQADAGQWRLAI
ncbi:hypothetical protein DF186_19075, partial [Enterococcus hirae]